MTATNSIRTLTLLATTILLNACASPETAPVKPTNDNPGSAPVTSMLKPNEVALLAAAGNGDLAQVQTLLSKGVNVNVKDNTGRTPLMMAVANGHAPVVKLLLEKGAKPNEHKNDGATALSLAGDKAEIKEMLVKAGAKSFKSELLEPLMAAASNGNLARVKELLQQGADINGQAPDGRTPLLDAVTGGRTEVVKYLLENGADPNQKKNDGATAMGFAQDKPEIKELLKKAGAKEVNPALLEKLIGAASKGDLAQVKAVIQQGADINSQTSDGRTALMDAAFNGQAETVKYLLENGADPNLKKTDGATALSLSPKYPAISEMLTKAGARQ